MTRIEAWFTPKRRQRLYLIQLAVLPILVAYGVLEAEAVPLWTALGLAMFGQGLASRNVDVPDDTPPAD